MFSILTISNKLFVIAQIVCAADLSTQTARQRDALQELDLIQSELFDLDHNATNGTTYWVLQPSTENFFENDIVLSDEQMDIILSDAKEQLMRKRSGWQKPRKRRTVVKELVYKWKQFPISIIIKGESGVDLAAIKEALLLWEEQTCVQFKELPSPKRGEPYIEFKVGSGCYSNVGRHSSSRQIISIDSNCSSVGMIAHLIGHSLGLFHEQARYDRDQYISVLAENIISGYANQFSKRSSRVMETFAVPYDYGSLMHFNQTHFSRIGLNTIEPTDWNYRYTMGQRTQLTFSDAKKINFAYCKGTCKTDLSCENDGYSDPKNCSRCRCPDVFDGNLCERARKTTSSICGADLDLTCSEKKQKIELSGSGECHYVVRSWNGQSVELDVMNFKFKNHIPCEHEYLEVRYGKHLSVTGARFCVSKPDKIISETSVLAISYRGTEKSRVALSFRCRASFLASTDSHNEQRNNAVAGSSSSHSETVTSSNSPSEIREMKIQTKNESHVSSSQSTETVIKTLEEPGPKQEKEDRQKIIIPELLVDGHFPNITDMLPEHKVFEKGEWTSWTSCTANCGGCGTQSRNKSLPYLTIQTRYCNTRMCENSGCCLPFTYVYKGTCLRPFVDNDNGTFGAGCGKFQIRTKKAMTEVPCIQSKTISCQMVEEKVDEEEKDVVLYNDRSSTAVGRSSGIDVQNKQLLEQKAKHYPENQPHDSSFNGRSPWNDSGEPPSNERLLKGQEPIHTAMLLQEERSQLKQQAIDGSIDDYVDNGSGEDTGVDYSSRKISYFYDENPHL